MTKPLFALLALLALAPTVASAQAGMALGSPDPDAVVEAVEVPEAPPTALIDPEILALRGESRVRPAIRFESTYGPVAAEQDEPSSDGPSFGRSYGHAWAGFGIGGGVGGLGGGALGLALTCGGSDGWCIIWGMVGAGLGAGTLAPFGAALATWGFGERNGGTGNFFASLGGAYLGTGLGIGLSAALASAGGDGGSYGAALGPIFGVLLTTLGAAAGYQLSSHGGADDAGETAQGPSIVPTFDTVEGGATAGIAGMF
ncbi:MAG: hypothetical protein H6719_34475 [Sandaracinaceae bacterium]|nr:hypothetical protein [Sandaracinaceae bacterium]